MSLPKTQIPGFRIAADIGGTFTDVVVIRPDGQMATSKVPSTPHDYAEGVVNGIADLLQREKFAAADVSEVLHACTVATNAILEGKGAKTALLTTRGFRDVLEMRRTRVPKLYDPLYVKPPVLVPRHLRLEIGERVDAQGAVIDALQLESVEAAIETLRAEAVEAVAVVFLHSYANPEHEQVVGRMLREALPNAFVTLSCDVLPEIREYERTSTTVINALVGPPVERYLRTLRSRLLAMGLPKDILIMHSAGGVLSLDSVVQRPAQIVECGPAAGVVGAQAIGKATGHPNLISFDMGGTTAKASLIENGALTRADEYEVGGGISLSSKLSKGGGYALKLPVIDISEVGAGGGSIVWIDRGGSLKVGPHSAGSHPGPACYGKGNTEATVTDANVVLGYLNPHALAGGTVPIRSDLAVSAIETKVAAPLGMALERAAYGVHEIITTVMTRAVKSVTTYRGRDPRDFTMIAFGGNGGIHSVSIARALGIPRVLVPIGAGVFSALGLLAADLSAEASGALRADIRSVDLSAVSRLCDTLARRACTELGTSDAVSYERLLDLRYAGQAFELPTPLESGAITRESLARAMASFEDQHEQTYGHKLTGATVEVTAVRVIARAAASGASGIFPHKRAAQLKAQRLAYFGSDWGSIATPVIDRSTLAKSWRQGPLIVEEYEGTTVVPPDCRAMLDQAGNIVVEVGASK